MELIALVSPIGVLNVTRFQATIYVQSQWLYGGGYGDSAFREPTWQTYELCVYRTSIR